MPAIERNDMFTELVSERVPADGVRCSECNSVGEGDTLLIYATVRGARKRTHNGSFCSRLCHDRFHGLARK